MAKSAAGNGTHARIQYRTLGRTGERVSCLGLGGAHIGKPKPSDRESIRIIREALDGGLNFLDNSWDYNDDRSETRMGKAFGTAIVRRPLVLQHSRILITFPAFTASLKAAVS